MKLYPEAIGRTSADLAFSACSLACFCVGCYAWPSVLRMGGGGCKQQIFIRGGRLRPKVQPLTLLYTIFDRKGTFRIPHINKRYPFTCIVSNFAYLLTVVNALF